MRKYIRHPASIPIEVRACLPEASAPGFGERRVHDVSQGGLSFHSVFALDPGTMVSIRIPLVRPAFETVGRVVWCDGGAAGYRVGIEFLQVQDEFRVRMVEQVCHIESYKRKVEEVEKREISIEAAAMEWISRFAAQFPDAGAEDLH